MSRLKQLSTLYLALCACSCWSELATPGEVVRFAPEAAAAGEANASASLACDRSFDPHLRFQGISELVCERVARPKKREMWALPQDGSEAPRELSAASKARPGGGISNPVGSPT